MGIPDCRPTPIRRPSPGWAPCGSQLCCSGDLTTKLYPPSCLRKDVEWSGEYRPSRVHGYRAMLAQRSYRQNAYRLSRHDTLCGHGGCVPDMAHRTLECREPEIDRGCGVLLDARKVGALFSDLFVSEEHGVRGAP
jgi:hypothetical protein